jgi:hypothetical protein
MSEDEQAARDKVGRKPPVDSMGGRVVTTKAEIELEVQFEMIRTCLVSVGGTPLSITDGSMDDFLEGPKSRGGFNTPNEPWMGCELPNDQASNNIISDVSAHFGRHLVEYYASTSSKTRRCKGCKHPIPEIVYKKGHYHKPFSIKEEIGTWGFRSGIERIKNECPNCKMKNPINDSADIFLFLIKPVGLLIVVAAIANTIYSGRLLRMSWWQYGQTGFFGWLLWWRLYGKFWKE